MKKVTLIIVVILLAIIGMVIIVLSIKDKDVHLTYLSCEKASSYYKGDTWLMIREKDEKEIQRYGIDTNKYNLKEYNLVVSFGRQINSMKYKRSSEFPYLMTNYVRTVLSQEEKVGDVFIYKLPKTEEVFYDERSNKENIIQR